MLPATTSRLAVGLALAGSLLACLALPAAARADGAPRTTLGVQALALSGFHREPGYDQSGSGIAALLEFTQRFSRVELHLEGIPVVTTTAHATSQEFGATAPALGVFSATGRIALDRHRRIWIGAGATIINQRTPLPAMQRTAESRLAGGRYELLARLPARNAHVVELEIGVIPRMFGTDHFLFDDPTHPPINKDEHAAETDVSAAYGVRRGRNEYLVGVRSINFSADFSRPGDAADRNVAFGLTFEARFGLGRR
ncbi:MAG TPA: hypothetical protein VNJ51_14385 [Candidatus Dormibacteraeota bacterium]|nr:hypothetical protein [Candidatus Dormibacteraeota bacterium]